MKKILMIFGALMLFIGAQSQNANRSGVVVELGGGYTTGNVYNDEQFHFSSYYDYFYDEIVYNSYYTDEKEGQGAYISLDAGYQWATSRHFAVKAMATIGLPVNYMDVFNFGVKGMLRYTSNDFGSGQSFYIEAGIGPKLCSCGGVGVLVAPEIGAGINITSHIYLGLDFVYNITTDDYVSLSYGVPQLKVGYRF